MWNIPRDFVTWTKAMYFFFFNPGKMIKEKKSVPGASNLLFVGGGGVSQL